MRHIIKVDETYVVNTVKEVEDMHEEFLHNPLYQLTGYSYKTKAIKKNGQIEDEYQVVKATKVFNEEKEPIYDIDIIYSSGDGSDF